MRLGRRLRLHILTGFLGSGKSTLLRRYLHQSAEPARVAVLVNEFGAVGIDHTLVRAVSVGGQSLSGGCACCQGDGELRKALLSLLTQVQRGELARIEDIILETSGVADPSRIVGTIAGEMHLDEYLEVASCVTVVECGTTESRIERFPEMRNQIACASKVVISKSDLHDSAALRETSALIRRCNPLAGIAVSTGESDLDDLFAVGHSVPRIEPLDRTHHARYSTFQIEVGSRLSWPSFSVWLTSLLHRHGGAILRFKGIIPLDPEAGDALVLQAVRHQVYEPEHLSLSEDEENPGYGLVFICEGEYEQAVRDGLRRFEEICGTLA